MDWMIERAAVTDARALLAFLRQVGAETNNLSFGSEGLPLSEKEEEAYLLNVQNSADEIMLVAKEKGQIVGIASLSRLPRRMKHRGEISICVLQAFWNRGIGRRLLIDILDLARQQSFEIIDLQVRSDNLAAIHLYKKFGFEKIGTHPAFFKIENEKISFDYMTLKM